MRLLLSVTFASSSSWKLDGLRPPPAVKSKSCASLGTVSFRITIWPRFWLVNVQVTSSPMPMLMFETGLPSLHVALLRSQPLGTEFSVTP